MFGAACRIWVSVFLISVLQNAAVLGKPARSTLYANGRWGFDLGGADFTTRPGDEFFRYGNGTWYDRAVISPDRSSAGVFLDLSNIAESRIRQIIENSDDSADSFSQADAGKIRAIYSAFMDEARAETLDVQPIGRLIQLIRGMGNRGELADLMGADNYSFFSSVFSIDIGPDDKEPDRYIVSIGQGGLGLNREYYLAPEFVDHKAAYLSYITQLLSMIDWEAPERTAKAILAFETAVAEASWSEAERNDLERTYNPMSVVGLEEMAPFPWRRLLTRADLGHVDHIVVAENTAVAKIADIYERTTLDTLKAWQAFRVVDAAAPYLSKRFVDANFAFRQKTIKGVTKEPERWKLAVDTVDQAMGQAVGRLYVTRYFTRESKTQISRLVAQLRIALKDRIQRLDWISRQTKLKALDKLARLNVKVAYPDKWRDYSDLKVQPDDLVGDIQASWRFDWLRRVSRLNSPVDRDEWGMNPQEVNAYYDVNLNEMILPAGILQSPFFSSVADPAVNYGGIGALVGHEMIHGFDNDGRKYDGAGALSDWWTNVDAKHFKERAGVLGQQAEAYEPLPGIHIKGDLTMSENIADLGGALVALEAYHHSLGGKRAPVIDAMTGDQRFFLSYAQSSREKSTDDAIREQIVSDRHAPVQYRVNGVVRNIDVWYKAFSVSEGDKLFLAPKDRVRIW